MGRGRAEDITLIEDDFETVAQFHPVCSDDFGEWEAIVTDSNQAPLPSFNPPFAATTPFRVPSPALPNELVMRVFPPRSAINQHFFTFSFAGGGDGWDIMPPDNNSDDMAELESERARKSVNPITPNISFPIPPPPPPLEQDQDEELPSETDQMPIARTSILNSKGIRRSFIPSLYFAINFQNQLRGPHLQALSTPSFIRAIQTWMKKTVKEAANLEWVGEIAS